mmetsp:Transcript_675/g.1553  ORF Transcript_675/g.1553 Transcript_675/m.1553 type:complete len:229 (-) Transcript_675:2093-2779(-)
MRPDSRSLLVAVSSSARNRSGSARQSTKAVCTFSRETGRRWKPGEVNSRESSAPFLTSLPLSLSRSLPTAGLVLVAVKGLISSKLPNISLISAPSARSSCCTTSTPVRSRGFEALPSKEITAPKTSWGVDPSSLSSGSGASEATNALLSKSNASLDRPESALSHSGLVEEVTDNPSKGGGGKWPSLLAVPGSRVTASETAVVARVSGSPDKSSRSSDLPPFTHMTISS